MNNLEQEAKIEQEIIDYFFERGARLCKADALWLNSRLSMVYEAGKAEGREKERRCFEIGMAFIKNLQHRCPQCGKETQTPMTYLESYRINALWGKCFECAEKENSQPSGLSNNYQA